MQIMSQDRKHLINADHAHMFYISETPEEATLFAAILDGDIVIGTYEKPSHAEMALKFIATSRADPEDRDKITMIPTREELESIDDISSKMPKGLLRKIFSDLAEQLSENSEDSECTCPVCTGKKN